MMQAGQTSVDVIISYSRTDSDFVDRLEADLKAHNLTVWVDRRKLEGGQVWDAEIRSAIDHCRVLLMVISPDALDSPWVTKEYQYALKRHKEVIPLRLYPTGELPPELQRLQWVDFLLTMNFESTYPAHLQELLKAIHLRIERYTADEAARRATLDKHKKRSPLRLVGGIALSSLLIVLLAGIIAHVFFPNLIHVPIFVSTPTSTPPSMEVATPRLAGTYQGSYLYKGASYAYPMQIQISQAGSQLSGATILDSVTTIDSGTIDAHGNVMITEHFAYGIRTLHGSMVKQGHLLGTWAGDSGSGTWDVSAQGLIPSIAGSYQGGYTEIGQSGIIPIQIQINQSDSQLSGTTTTGNTTAIDSGTIDANGNFTMYFSFSGGGGIATLYGSIVNQGHLSGTWTDTHGNSGDWDVTRG
jgi:hypothetical protein